MAINVVAALLLVRAAGFRGLALATFTALANGGVLLMLLGRHLHGLDGGRLTGATVKVSLHRSSWPALRQR
jgi:hypothetical protein